MPDLAPIRCLVLAFLAATTTAQVAEIPFVMTGDHMLIEVRLTATNTPCQFVFDTGATAAVVDSTFAEQNHLKPGAEIQAQGAAGTATHKIAADQQVRLTDDLVISGVTLVMADLSDLMHSMGLPFAGIIGNDILQHYLTRIDFSNNKILLYEFGTELATDGYTAMPFTFGNGIQIPQFKVGVVLNDGQALRGIVLLDSGAGLTLMMNSPVVEAQDVIARSGRTITEKSMSLTKETATLCTSIKSLTLGDFKWQDVPIMLATDKQGVSALPGYLGILGGAVIRRFDWNVDYQHKVMQLRPNRFFDAPFEFPMSGAAFKKVAGVVAVASVVDDSPAQAAGLQAGDRIVAVDDYEGTDLETIRSHFKAVGRTVKVTVVRGTERLVLEWVLRRLV